MTAFSLYAFSAFWQFCPSLSSLSSAVYVLISLGDGKSPVWSGYNYVLFSFLLSAAFAFPKIIWLLAFSSGSSLFFDIICLEMFLFWNCFRMAFCELLWFLKTCGCFEFLPTFGCWKFVTGVPCYIDEFCFWYCTKFKVWSTLLLSINIGFPGFVVFGLRACFCWSWIFWITWFGTTFLLPKLLL